MFKQLFAKAVNSVAILVNGTSCPVFSIVKWADSMTRRYGWAPNSAFVFMAIRYQFEPEMRDMCEKFLEAYSDTPSIHELCYSIAKLELNLTSLLDLNRVNTPEGRETVRILVLVNSELEKRGYMKQKSSS